MILTRLESRYAMALAKTRQEWAKKNGGGRRIFKPGMTMDSIELGAAGAEIAFCHMADLYPDMDGTSPRVFDAWTRGGEFIDVKHTNHLNGELRVTVSDARRGKNRCDWYVLMVGIFPIYKYAGRIAADDLLVDWRIVTEGLAVPNYVATQRDLSGEIAPDSWRRPAALGKQAEGEGREAT